MTGWALLALALALYLSNMSDAFHDLTDWHAATTTQFISVCMKHLSDVLLGVVGGRLSRVEV